MKKTVLIAMLFLVAGVNSLNAQSGALDPTFSSGSGSGNLIQSTAVQADGKILIGGYFTNYAGNPINRIARVNSDGSFDASFNPGTGANDVVNKIAVLSDGKILIAGSFSTINGVDRSRIARLNADGTLDNSFDPGTGASNNIFDMAVQQDGKILIVGAFSTYNGVGRNGIARLNTNGSLDITFDPGAGSGINVISRIALQNDGKLVIGGGFTTYNNVPRSYMARVNADGSLDNTFDPGLGANYPKNIVIQNDGKILIGGGFTSYNGTSRNGIARINSDGTLDNTFDPGLGAQSGDVESIVLLPNGNLVIVGSFTSYNGTSRNYISGVLPTGQLDNDFVVGTGFDWVVSAITTSPNNKLVVVGFFNFYNGTVANQICRILLDDPIVNIPDANFKAVLVGNSNINTNGDTEIQVSEAQAYTGSINVYNANIADLTGIEAFTGITALNCGENQLSSLNLTNNAALLSITCSGNQLTTLDISAQTVLAELYCDGNQLTSLNTNNNAALSVLWCNSNQLSALDVSSNLALTVLQCNMNLLTSINTSNNTMLTSLGCTGNQLTALDMSSNSALTVLGCQNNNLTSLNLKNGNNTNMTALYVVGGNSGLTCIEVDDAAYCTANWTGSGFMLDPQTSFSEDCSTASVSENYVENMVILFPNPTRDLVHFSAPSNFHLTNVAGQILMSGSAMNSLDLSNQPAGIYFLIFTDAAGNVIQHNKIVKE
jgi:uncharacterized delta-60 repeat protein